MKFLIASERQIKHYKIIEPHIIISITSPASEYAIIPDLKSCKGILYLKFPDLDRKHEGYPYNDHIFNKKMAKKICKFFHSYINKISLTICNCEAGISRSAAVGAALCKAIGQDDSKFFKRYIPNRLVYRTLLETLYENIKD